MRVHLDFETRCDLDLKKVGLRRYLAHKSFRVLLTALAFGDGPVLQWEGLPPLVRRWPVPGLKVHAFNASFERGVLERCGVKVPPHLWRDTMAHAYARGFAGTLAQVGEQVGIEQDKAKLASGTRLITKFCMPRRPSKRNPEKYWTPVTAPKDWAEFRRYNVQDVEAERAVWHCLAPYPWTREEQEIWEWDQQVNGRGIPVDLVLVENALQTAADKQREAEAACADLTGGIGPGQVGELLKWACEQGYTGMNLQAQTIEEYLNEHF